MLDYKMGDFEFLQDYHLKLLPHLFEVFNVDKKAIECFLNNEHNYSCRDWNTGEKWSVILRESIKYTKYLKRLNSKKNIFILSTNNIICNANVYNDFLFDLM